MTKEKPVRGRPPQFDREAALREAQQLFHALGFDGAGIARLSEAIGVNPPSLYAAFGNKVGLFELALKRYVKTRGQFMAKAFGDALSVEDGLRRMLEAAVEVYTEDPACSGCMVLEGSHTAQHCDARAICLDIKTATERNIAAFVGRERPEQSKQIASLTMIALAGLSAAARSGADRRDLSAFATHFCDQLFG